MRNLFVVRGMPLQSQFKQDLLEIFNTRSHDCVVQLSIDLNQDFTVLLQMKRKTQITLDKRLLNQKS